ncbi:MAG: hypothetical protein ACRD6W_05315, partial [Nitrososphaerales archaeon]
GSDVLLTDPEAAPKPSERLEYLPFKEAVKLARMKPDKGFTRNDLLVYAGWLTKRWEWSRDRNLSLDDAIANGLRLGDQVKIVAERAKAKTGNGDARGIHSKLNPSPVSSKPASKWSLFGPKRKRSQDKD